MSDQGYARPELLASTEWLAEHIDDPNVRVVDCDEFDPYLRAHIKNAVGIRVHHYIKHPDYPGAPTQYPLVAEPDVMKGLMEEMGIGDDTLVVAYDNSGSLYSTRFWWVLNYYGHTNVKVLNGGWKKWFDEGRPTSIDPASGRRRGHVHSHGQTTRWSARSTTALGRSGTMTRCSGTCDLTGSGTAPTTGATRVPAACRAPFTWSGST